MKAILLLITCLVALTVSEEPVPEWEDTEEPVSEWEDITTKVSIDAKGSYLDVYEVEIEVVVSHYYATVTEEQRVSFDYLVSPQYLASPFGLSDQESAGITQEDNNDKSESGVVQSRSEKESGS